MGSFVEQQYFPTWPRSSAPLFELIQRMEARIAAACSGRARGLSENGTLPAGRSSCKSARTFRSERALHHGLQRFALVGGSVKPNLSCRMSPVEPTTTCGRKSPANVRDGGPATLHSCQHYKLLQVVNGTVKRSHFIITVFSQLLPGEC